METRLFVNDIQINYYDSHPGTDGMAAVVLVHGLGGCWQAWKYQQQFLEAQGFRVVAVDLRGHAGSDQPHTAYTVELMADDVGQLIERLDLAPCAVVGHSLGGMVSYQLAATRSELVSRLVIINSFSRIPKISLKAIVKVVYRTSLIYGLGLQAWAHALAWELLPRLDQAHLRAELLDLSTLNQDRTAYMNSLKAAVKVDLRPRLPMIACPVRLLAADRDYTATSEKIRDAALINRHRGPAADDLATVVEIKNSRHLSLWDQADAVNQEIYSFLRP